MDYDQPCCVYRHYDKHGCLLYVGTTVDLVLRTRHHSLFAGWFRPYALDISHHWYPTVLEARAEEWKAIKAELPIFNVMGRPYTRDRTVEKWLAEPRHLELAAADKARGIFGPYPFWEVNSDEFLTMEAGLS